MDLKRNNYKKEIDEKNIYKRKEFIIQGMKKTKENKGKKKKKN